MPFPAGLKAEIFSVKSENPMLSDEEAFKIAFDQYHKKKAASQAAPAPQAWGKLRGLMEQPE